MSKRRSGDAVGPASGAGATKRRKKQQPQLLTAEELESLNLTYEEFLALPEVTREGHIFDLDSKRRELAQREHAEQDLQRRQREELESARQKKASSKIVYGSDTDDESDASVKGEPTSPMSVGDSEEGSEEGSGDSDWEPRSGQTRGHSREENKQIRRGLSHESSEDEDGRLSDHGGTDDEDDSDSADHSRAGSSSMKMKRKRRSRFDGRAEDKRESEKACELSDLRAAQLTCSELEKMITEPYFDDSVLGLFVRGRVEQSSSGYRAMRIAGVRREENRAKCYNLRTRREIRTDRVLLCQVLGRPRTFDFRTVRVSDSEFTEQEFESFCKFIRANNELLPSKAELRSAMAKLRGVQRRHRVNSEDILRMRDQKLESTDLEKDAPNMTVNQLFMLKSYYNNLKQQEMVDKVNQLIQERSKHKVSRSELISERNRRQNMNRSGSGMKGETRELSSTVMRKLRMSQQRSGLMANHTTRHQSTRGIRKHSLSDNIIKDERLKRGMKSSDISGSLMTKREENSAMSQIKSEQHSYVRKPRVLPVARPICERLSGLTLMGDDDEGGGSLVKPDPSEVDVLRDVLRPVAMQFGGFIEELHQLDPLSNDDHYVSDPIFGRNTGKSLYASEFEVRPECKIISLAEHDALIHGQTL